ncbi:MAG: oligosaccharide flippase family protein [Bacteroidetes bacterium]|nr:oligosaccharide flippase family protein [Bacteroidota bacterium]
MKSILKKTFFILLSDAFIRIFGFLAYIYIARVSEQYIFGVIAFGLAVLNYSSIFASLGLNTLGTKFIAQNTYSDKYLLNKIAKIKLVLSLIVFSIIILIPFLFQNFNDTFLSAIIFSLALIPISFQAEWFLQGKFETTKINIGQLINAILYPVIIFTFYNNQNNWIIIPIAFLIGNIFQAIYLMYISSKSVENLSTNIISVKELLKQCLPLSIVSILIQVLINLPPILIGIFVTVTEVGFYSAALKLILFTLVIDRILNLILFPFLSKLATNMIKLKLFLDIFLKWIFVFLILFGLILFFLSDYLILFAYGSQFANSILYFKIFLVFLVSTIINSIISFTYISLNQLKKYSKVYILMTPVILVSYLITVYKFGGIGLAAAFSFGELIIATVLFYNLSKFIQINFKIINFKDFKVMSDIVKSI